MIVSAGSDQTIVCGSTANLNAILNGTVPNVTYVWAPTTALTGPTTATPNVKPTTTTTYTITASVAGCTPATDAVQVTVNPLTVNAGIDQSIVCGGTASLNASLNGTVPNVTYAWTPITGLTGPTTATPSAKPTTTTTYTVTASVTGCTLATDAVQVTVNPLTVNAGSDQTITCGNPANLSATLNGTVPNASYTWSPTTGLTGSSSASPTATPIATTTYTVTANVTGCTPATDAVQITVNPYTVSAGSTQTITCGNAASLNATLSSPVPGVNYAWTPSAELSGAATASPTASPTSSTTYTVTATTASGCSASNTVNVNVNPYTVNATASLSTVNCGSPTVLNAALSSGAPQGVTYSWTPNYNLSSPTAQNPTATPGTTTTYTVTATTPNGCSATSSVTVTVNNPNPPVATITTSTGDVRLCNGSLTLNAGSGSTSYLWSTGATSQSVNVTQPGTYTVTIEDQSGCAGNGSITVTEFVNIIAPQGTLVCTNQSNTVQLDAGTGYTSYQWSTGSNSQFITVSQPGTYTVNVTQGSCTGTASIAVTQSTGQATADFSYDVSGLTVAFTAIGNGINFVSWEFGNGQTSFDLNPTHTFPQQGSYTVTLTVTDICGQTASATQVVNVTGVSVEGASSATFSLRPNPTDGPLLLQFGTDAPRTATLMDATGREVLTATLTGTSATLDLSRLSSGIYVLRVAEGISTQHLRVVRQ